MMGIPTNNKKVQEKAKREAMNRISQNAKVKIMKSEMAEKKLSPIGYAKKEKKESMKREAMESMAEKATMAMKPSKMYRRRMA
jgi:hypothetical protein